MTPWAWAAAGVGALIGHAIGVHACHNHWRQAYYYGDYDGPPPPHPHPYAYYHYPYAYYEPGPGYYGARYDYYRRVPVAHHHHCRCHHDYAGRYTALYAPHPRG